MQLVSAEPGSGWNSLYKLGGTTVLIAVVIPLAEVAIGFFPGVARTTRETVTVIDWFTLFQTHWFLGLRNLGLLNLVGAALQAPTILAIYFAIRRDHEAYGVLGTILFFPGASCLRREQQGFPYAFPQRPIRQCYHRRAEISIKRGRAGDAC